MKRTVVASLFVFLFCVGQAMAAGQVAFFAGYLSPGDLSLDNIQESLRLRDTGLYGARVEFDFLKVLAIEQNIAFSPRLFDSALFPDEATELRGVLYGSNLMLNIPISRFVPYLTGGFGFIKPWGSGIEPFDATFAGNYGGGVKFNRLAGPVGLRFDVRGWRTGDIAGRGNINMFEATGAVTFTWEDK